MLNISLFYRRSGKQGTCPAVLDMGRENTFSIFRLIIFVTRSPISYIYAAFTNARYNARAHRNFALPGSIKIELCVQQKYNFRSNASSLAFRLSLCFFVLVNGEGKLNV